MHGGGGGIAEPRRLKRHVLGTRATYVRKLNRSNSRHLQGRSRICRDTRDWEWTLIVNEQDMCQWHTIRG